VGTSDFTPITSVLRSGVTSKKHWFFEQIDLPVLAEGVYLGSSERDSMIDFVFNRTRALSISIVGLACVLVVITVGCKSSDRTAKKRFTLLKGSKMDAGVSVLPDGKKVEPLQVKRRTLPPALTPQSKAASSLSSDGEKPCGVLTDRVCALLGQGAEECAMARSRVKRRARSVSHERCQRTLDWYRLHTDDGRRGHACRHLSNTVCRLYGVESSECDLANERAARGHQSERYKSTCWAELLLVKGLP